jgi:hypothetical protein
MIAVSLPHLRASIRFGIAITPKPTARTESVRHQPTEQNGILRSLGGVTDGRLRELERRWKETGAVEDEARYLQARVRIGLTPRIELAAALGYAPARRAIELLEYEETWDLSLDRRVAVVVRTPSGDPETFLQDLVPYGKESLIRASLAALQFATRRQRNAPDEALLNAIEAWAVAPTADAAAAVRERMRVAHVPRSAVRYVAQAVGETSARHAFSWCRTALDECRRRYSLEDWEVIDAIRDGVVPWALGR